MKLKNWVDLAFSSHQHHQQYEMGTKWASTQTVITHDVCKSINVIERRKKKLWNRYVFLVAPRGEPHQWLHLSVLHLSFTLLVVDSGWFTSSFIVSPLSHSPLSSTEFCVVWTTNNRKHRNMEKLSFWKVLLHFLFKMQARSEHNSKRLYNWDDIFPFKTRSRPSWLLHVISIKFTHKSTNCFRFPSTLCVVFLFQLLFILVF